MPPSTGEYESQKFKLHLIDDQLNLSKDLMVFLRDKWHLAGNGFNYNFVAVFGAQSTGKSTLLNMLFETDFDIMQLNALQQTTKGLWLSVGNPINTLVMDVEGTDGRERGEDLNMERKSTVFSLAIAQVLIVNMFENDIGRYSGANYGLLKTVFEVNLQLFQTPDSAKTLLLFVIRDQARNSLEVLSAALKTDLDKIWDGLAKPKGFENTRIEDFFALEFTALPHKIFQLEEFKNGVTKLRSRFSDPKNPHYFFQEEFHKKIPADGLHKYAEDIWLRIKDNKDLDLPTQRELLAQFRCNEISTKAFEAMSIESKNLTDLVLHSMVHDLGRRLSDLKQKTLAEYDETSHRYALEVFVKVRDELIEKIHNNFKPIFTLQLEKELKFSANQFKEKLPVVLKREKSAPFLRTCAVLEEEIKSSLEARMKKLVLQDTDWDYEFALSDLKELIQNEISVQRKAEVQRVRSESEKTLKKTVLDPLDHILKEITPKMWTQTQGVIDLCVQQVNEFTNTLLTDYGCPEAELDEQKTTLKKYVVSTITTKIQNETMNENMLLWKMKRKFDVSFRSNMSSWRSVEELQGLFERGQKEAMELLAMLAKPNIDLSVLDPEVSLQQFSITIEQEIKLKSLLEIEAKEALRIETQKAGDIFELFRGFFGWFDFDEIMASSPQLLFRSATFFISAVSKTRIGRNALMVLTVYLAGRYAKRILWN